MSSFDYWITASAWKKRFMSTNTFLLCFSVGPSLNQAEAIVSQSLALHKLVKSERCASFDRKKAFLSKLLSSHLDGACDDYLFPTSGPGFVSLHYRNTFITSAETVKVRNSDVLHQPEAKQHCASKVDVRGWLWLWLS